ENAESFFFRSPPDDLELTAAALRGGDRVFELLVSDERSYREEKALTRRGYRRKERNVGGRVTECGFPAGIIPDALHDGGRVREITAWPAGGGDVESAQPVDRGPLELSKAGSRGRKVGIELIIGVADGSVAVTKMRNSRRRNRALGHAMGGGND